MTTSYRAAGAAGALALAAALWSSCFVGGFDLVEPTAAGGAAVGGSGGGAGAGSSGGMGGSACGSKQWPDPPTTPDRGSDVEATMALRTIDFGEGDLSVGPVVGYDLDGRCSCGEDGLSCNTPDPSKQSCDGPGGVDNAIAELFAAASIFQDNFTSAYHADRAEDGKWSILVRIRGYNGQANDDQIEVAMFPSGGLDEDPCHAQGTPPAWNGSDAWPIMTSALEEPMGGGGAGAGGNGGCGDPEPAGYSLEQPRYFDGAAYVSDHVMVASLPEAGVALSADGAGINLTAGFLTGRLEQSGGAWSLREGVLAGRWALTEVFATMSSLGSDGTALCTDDTSYQLIRDAVCAKRDITAQISGPTAPCDAVSFGMAFEAEPAQLGVIYFPEPGSGGGCPPETDPQNDACPDE